MPFGADDHEFHFQTPSKNKLLTEYRNTRSESKDGTESQISDKIIIDGENRTVTLWKDYQHVKAMMLSVYDYSAWDASTPPPTISNAITIYPSDTSISVRLNTKLGNFGPETYELEISSYDMYVLSCGQVFAIELNDSNNDGQLDMIKVDVLSDYLEVHHWMLSSKTGGILSDCFVYSSVDIFSTEYETSNLFRVSFADNEIPTFTHLRGVTLSANGSSTGYDATVSNNTLADVRINYDYASHIVEVSGTYGNRGWGREYLVVRESH